MSSRVISETKVRAEMLKVHEPSCSDGSSKLSERSRESSAQLEVSAAQESKALERCQKNPKSGNHRIYIYLYNNNNVDRLIG